MKRNFETFKTGWWYVYTGNERHSKWASMGFMDFVLDHKPVKCVFGSGFDAKFDCQHYDRNWNWETGIDDWIELTDDEYYIRYFRYEYINHKAGDIITWNNASTSKPITTVEIPGTKFYTKDGFMLASQLDELKSQANSEHKFKVGDKVKIVKKVSGNGATWLEDMDHYMGSTQTVSNIHNEERVSLVGIRWTFSNEWLELVEATKTKFKKGDKVKIVSKVTGDKEWKKVGYFWNPYTMDEYIGTVQIIDDIIKVGFTIRGTNIVFPFECAELVEEIEDFQMTFKTKKNITTSQASLKAVAEKELKNFISDKSFTLGSTAKALLFIESSKQKFTIPEQEFQVTFKKSPKQKFTIK